MKNVDLHSAEGFVALPIGFGHKGEHPQLNVPFTVFVGEHVLTGVSLSLTSAVVFGGAEENKQDTVETVTLRLDFAGFTLLLDLDAWIEWTGDRGGMFILHFLDPLGDHSAALRHVLNSYISGDIVSLAGVLGYTGPVAVGKKVAEAEPGASHKILNVLRRTVVAALTVGLALIALSLAHERVVFTYEARPVTVTAPGQTLLATAAGQLTYVDPQARDGEVVYAILANSGEYLSIRMPCDCAILPMHNFSEGATVLRGTPVVRISNGTEGLVASTEISAEGAVKLVGGHQAELVMSDGAIVPVTPTIVPSPDNGDWSVRVEMTLQETDGVIAGQIGRLRFRRSLLPFFLK